MSEARRKTIAAVEKAMDASLYPDFQWWESSEERIAFILDAAEPVIREQIARDIEAHYIPPNGDIGPFDYDEGLHTAALLARGSCGFVDCLACARIARGDS